MRLLSSPVVRVSSRKRLHFVPDPPTALIDCY
jgi:hypothetical protein